MIMAAFLLMYQIWTPGKRMTDGRHDLKSNGIWLQHGWLGDDAWFRRYHKNSRQFRNPTNLLRLKRRLLDHHITDLFPHVAPCQPGGDIARVDQKQAQQFLAVMDEIRVIPWVGGVLDVHAFPESSQWRRTFVDSIHTLLVTHPLFAGIHINIEPLPSGHSAYIELLEEIKQRLPKGKVLSIAAYPPPTLHQRSSDVHWDKAYYQEVAKTVNQMVVMMYDTGIRYQKLYQHLMASWTQEVIDWSGKTDVLLGVPAYDDEGVKYHFPHVENLKNSLLGIHAGLERYASLPKNYKGVSIYSEWEMEQEEWNHLKAHYLRK